MISATERKKRIKFKKPLFFSSVFFASKHTNPRQKKGYYIHLRKYIRLLHRRKKKASEKESESSAKRVLFVLSSVCFFSPSSFLFVVNEEAILKRAHDARVYIYDWVPPPPDAPPPPLCPS